MLRAAGLAAALLAAGIAFADEALRETIDRLATGDAGDQLAVARELASSGDPRVAGVITALIDGRLYERREDGRVVVARREGRRYRLSDPLDGSSLGTGGRRDVARVAVPVSLRDSLRGLIVDMQLADADPAQRLAAADMLLDDPANAPVDLVRARLENERNRSVRFRLESLLLLNELESAEEASRPALIEALADYSNPGVRSALASVADDGSRTDAERDAARRAITRIEERLSGQERLKTIFFGLSLGSVLVLAAIGLAITFGVMGVINMAHGELIMLGAYTAWGMQQLLPDAIGLALVLAVPAAFAVSGLTGILIERSVIRYLYQRPVETLLATFGISLILQQAVRSLLGPLNKSVAAPAWMSGSVEVVEGLALTWNRITITGFALAVFAAVLVLIRFSRFGLEMRAVAQNREIARAMGVRSSRVDALTFGLGSGIAGVAGVALSQLTNVGPNLGQSYIIDSFLVVVVGGVGNLWGTLVAGLSIGVASKFLEPLTGAVMAKVLLLVLIILFIQKRPRGLFPQRGRAAEA